MSIGAPIFTASSVDISDLQAVIGDSEVWTFVEHDGPSSRTSIIVSEEGEQLLNENAPELLVRPDYILRSDGLERNSHRIERLRPQ